MIERRSLDFLMDGGTQRYLQALDQTLKLHSLPTEGMVCTMASSRSHHVWPPAPDYRVSCGKKGKSFKTERNKDGEPAAPCNTTINLFSLGTGGKGVFEDNNNP